MFTKEELQQALPAKMSKGISDDLVMNLNAMIGDPDHYERIRENMIGYTHILSDGKYTVDDYLNAVMYASYKMAGMTNIDAFSKTFPDKMVRYRAAGKSVNAINSFVTAYNKTKLVTNILSQALVPVHILNMDLFQEAVNTEAALMRTAKSEKVRHEAAKALMDVLRPPTESKIKLDIGMTKSNIMDDLAEATAKLVQEQRRAIESGQMTARQIAESKIIEGEAIDVN